MDFRNLLFKLNNTCIFLIFCLSTHSVSCLETENIVDGYYAEDGQFKYQVVIYRDDVDVCGGGIIDDYFILTAAHCFIRRIDNEFYKARFAVVAGINELKDKTRNRIESNIRTIFVPALFNYDDYSNDIAVVQLLSSLNVRGNKRLMALNLPGLWADYAGRTAEIAGFGVNWVRVVENPNTHETSELAGDLDTALRYVKAKIIKNVECAQTNPGSVITPKILCARTEQRAGLEDAVCSGDSGSPLVYKNTVVGVLVASPYGCKETTEAAQYAKVSKFLTFIDNAKNNRRRKDMRIHDLFSYLETNEVY